MWNLCFDDGLTASRLDVTTDQIALQVGLYTCYAMRNNKISSPDVYL